MTAVILNDGSNAFGGATGLVTGGQAHAVSSREIGLAHVRIADQFAPAPLERERA
jgi:hypothetical protein